MYLTLFYFSHKSLMRFCFIILIRVNKHTLKKIKQNYELVYMVYGIQNMVFNEY